MFKCLKSLYIPILWKMFFFLGEKNRNFKGLKNVDLRTDRDVIPSDILVSRICWRTSLYTSSSPSSDLGSGFGLDLGSWSSLSSSSVQ